MEITEACRKTVDGVEVDLTVSPRASRSCIGEIDPWRKRLTVKVRSPPLDGRANSEVEEILAEATGCRVQIVSGLASRQKTAIILGDPEDIWSRLMALPRMIPSVWKGFLGCSADFRS